MKKLFKFIVIVVLILNVLVLTSCRSGWSCKNRYVEVDKPTIEQTKNS